jgi:methylated-DNA-[protein]-cysteine S-methyltransferase
MGKREEVYSLLKKVPRDRVTTYAELAKAAGTSPRAIGVYMRTNSDPEGIPCFRVIRSDGTPGGYSGPGGKDAKIRLLKENGIVTKDGKVNLEIRMHRF